MTDNQPDEDSLDGLIADLNGLYEDFDRAAAENWAKRQEAEEPDAGDGESGGGGDAADQQDTPGAAGSQEDREYQAQLFLVIPHHQNRRGRPLGRRSQGGSPPLDSTGVTVTPQGSNTPTDTIKPGNQYTVECTVQNVGGIGASAMTVELFEAHEQPDAVLDTTSQQRGTLEWTYGGGGKNDSDTTGITTLPPDSRYVLLLVEFVDSTSGDPTLRWDNIVGLADVPVEKDRTMSGVAFGQVFPDTNKPQEFLATGDPVNANSFTARLYDVSDISGKVERIVIKPNLFKSDLTKLVGLLQGSNATDLFETQGRWVKGRSHNHQPEDMDLSSTVGTATMKRQTQASIPANGRTTVSFSYTAPPSQNGRSLTELYARAYSLSPPDTPGNWGGLDHRTSRFVGRSELYWPVS